MHQVAHRHANDFSRDFRANLAIRIAMLGANPTDAELTASALNGMGAFELLGATADGDFCLALCQRTRPNLLILDPNSGHEYVVRALKLLDAGVVQHLLILDDEVRLGRLMQLLGNHFVSYVTRQCGLKEIAKCIQQIHQTGRRVFDPAVRERIKRDASEFVLEISPDDFSLQLLTERELEVMTLLAEGLSVRDCAQELQLAVSTVDNHKARVMKKLDIHKIVDLSHLAIREGLVVVK